MCQNKAGSGGILFSNKIGAESNGTKSRTPDDVKGCSFGRILAKKGQQ